MELFHVLLTVVVYSLHKLATTLCDSTEASLAPHKPSLYPFGPSHGDKILPHGDDLSVEVDLEEGEEFPFAEGRERKIFVNINGGLSFGESVDRYWPICGSSTTKNYRVVAPFWSDIHTQQNLGGEVGYRTVTDSALSAEISLDVNAVFPRRNGDEPYKITWAFIVTWYNVTYFGAKYCFVDSDTSVVASQNVPRNTFQVVLATDGVTSFVLFNYGTMEWTSWRRYQCGDVATCAFGEESLQPAFIGFYQKVNGDYQLHHMAESCNRTAVDEFVKSMARRGDGRLIARVDKVDHKQPLLPTTIAPEETSSDLVWTPRYPVLPSEDQRSLGKEETSIVHEESSTTTTVIKEITAFIEKLTSTLSPENATPTGELKEPEAPGPGAASTKQEMKDDELSTKLEQEVPTPTKAPSLVWEDGQQEEGIKTILPGDEIVSSIPQSASTPTVVEVVVVDGPSEFGITISPGAEQDKKLDEEKSVSPKSLTTATVEEITPGMTSSLAEQEGAFGSATPVGSWSVLPDEETQIGGKVSEEKHAALLSTPATEKGETKEELGTPTEDLKSATPAVPSVSLEGVVLQTQTVQAIIVVEGGSGEGARKSDISDLQTPKEGAPEETISSPHYISITPQGPFGTPLPTETKDDCQVTPKETTDMQMISIISEEVSGIHSSIWPDAAPVPVTGSTAPAGFEESSPIIQPEKDDFATTKSEHLDIAKEMSTTFTPQTLLPEEQDHQPIPETSKKHLLADQDKTMLGELDEITTTPQTTTPKTTTTTVIVDTVTATTRPTTTPKITTSTPLPTEETAIAEGDESGNCWCCDAPTVSAGQLLPRTFYCCPTVGCNGTKEEPKCANLITDYCAPVQKWKYTIPLCTNNALHKCWVTDDVLKKLADGQPRIYTRKTTTTEVAKMLKVRQLGVKKFRTKTTIPVVITAAIEEPTKPVMTPVTIVETTTLTESPTTTAKTITKPPVTTTAPPTEPPTTTTTEQPMNLSCWCCHTRWKRTYTCCSTPTCRGTPSKILCENSLTGYCEELDQWISAPPKCIIPASICAPSPAVPNPLPVRKIIGKI